MTLKAVVTLNSVSADEKDNVTNTFTIGGLVSGDDLDPAMEASLRDAFVSFYNDVPVGAAPALALSSYIGAQISRVALDHRIDLYDTAGKLDGSPHGSPVSSMTWSLGNPSSATGLPSEVAYCVTMESAGRAGAAVEAPDGADADAQIDRPQQRHTGRIYLGPLITGATAMVNGISRPAPGLGSTARLALKELNENIGTATAPTLSFLGIWSRKDQVIRPVAFVSTDDAFDTQRRRGEAPTARTRIAV